MLKGEVPKDIALQPRIADEHGQSTSGPEIWGIEGKMAMASPYEESDAWWWVVELDTELSVSVGLRHTLGLADLGVYFVVFSW